MAFFRFSFWQQRQTEKNSVPNFQVNFCIPCRRRLRRKKPPSHGRFPKADRASACLLASNQKAQAPFLSRLRTIFRLFLANESPATPRCRYSPTAPRAKTLTTLRSQALYAKNFSRRDKFIRNLSNPYSHGRFYNITKPRSGDFLKLASAYRFFNHLYLHNLILTKFSSHDIFYISFLNRRGREHFCQSHY